MPEMRLPLWLITERRLKDIPAIEHPVTDGSRVIMAFTCTERVAQVLRIATAGRWKLDLASDSTELLLLLADHHGHGVTHIRLDPAPDGSGGDLVPLADVFAFAYSVSCQQVD
jgi:hypothetical protein